MEADLYTSEQHDGSHRRFRGTLIRRSQTSPDCFQRSALIRKVLFIDVSDPLSERISEHDCVRYRGVASPSMKHRIKIAEHKLVRDANG